jgi:hypothetical protein
VGEKLNAFLKLYTTKAIAEVDQLKIKIAETEEKLKTADVLYKETLVSAESFKLTPDFLLVFPGATLFSENVDAYKNLLSVAVDPIFKKQVQDLYKVRNADTQLVGRKESLSVAESYVKKGGEDYLNKLASEILKNASAAGSRGANFTSIMDKLFKTYDDYAKSIEGFTEDIAGPDGMLTSPEAYAALVEKREAGQFNESNSAKPADSSTSSINAASSSTNNKEEISASINSTGSENKTTAPVASTPINPTATKSSDATSVTNSEGGVTSKVGELETENILEPAPMQAVNINLESKPPESKTVEGSTSNSTTASTTSNSTTVNDVNSTSSNSGVTGDKNIMNVDNTNNQSSSNTVNENKKEKGGFLSKVGNFAKKAGAALNLPSIGELGEQAKGLFGATGANISSKISDVKNSFAINSSDSESNSSPASSTETNSVNSSNTTNTTPAKPDDISGVPNTGTTSNTSNVLKTETQTAMSVEQNKPGVTASAPAATTTLPESTSASTTVLNTNNSQSSQSPQPVTSNISQNTQSTNQPSGNPAGVGVNVDTNQLAQSITRLERILISGIEVTIKDT